MNALPQLQQDLVRAWEDIQKGAWAASDAVVAVRDSAEPQGPKTAARKRGAALLAVEDARRHLATARETLADVQKSLAESLQSHA